MATRWSWIAVLVALLSAAPAQAAPSDPERDLDTDLLLAMPAWLAGDHRQALRHFRAAASRGNSHGQYHLSMMLMLGEGGPRRPTEAVAWMRRAAHSGLAPAQVEWAEWHEQGRHVRRLPRLAFHWYALAAAQDDARACAALARLYEKGQGVERDYSQAAHWKLRAAALGSPGAARKATVMPEHARVI